MEEKVQCVIHNANKSRIVGRGEPCNIVVTNQRLIFARLTPEMLKQANAEANRKGREEGKSFFQRLGDRWQVSLFFGDRYLTMKPEDIMSQDPGNFTMGNEEIESVAFKTDRKITDSCSPIRRVFGSVTFESKGDKHEYDLDGMPEDDISGLRKVMGDKVHE
jgi:hypothetical protein